MKLNNYQTNGLGNIRVNKKYNLKIKSGDSEKNIDLVFTNLPVIQIINDSKIYEEPKSLARIKINTPEIENTFSSFIGIEYRGKYSRIYKKRSLGFSLWKKMVSTETYPANLLGGISNTDWILTAAFNDPSRIRNLVSFEIWENLDSLQDEIHGNHAGIHCQPAEVFLNNNFRGLYLFSGLVNHEMLNLDEGAVLYKANDWAAGATKFESFDPEISSNKYWNGWEQKFPDSKELINWEPLNELYELVVNGTDEDFTNNIYNLIDIELFIDYFLFLNLTFASDNTGKNIFFFKKNANSKFKLLPWDLDGSWGIQYDGLQVGYGSILTNNLFCRLHELNPDNYNKKVKSRWQLLRENNFSREKLYRVFDKYFNLLNSSDIINQENKIWGIDLNISEEQNYIENWTTNRLIFLDSYFQAF